MVYSSSFILILFFILAYNNPSHSQKTIELPESKKLMLDYRLSKAIESEDYLEELSIYLQQGSESSGIYQLLLDSIFCLLYTSPSPRDRTRSRMPSSA